MRVLVTGGAGYIGSQTAKVLARRGHEPIVLDNLSEGHRWSVKWGPFIEGDVGEPQALSRAFQEHQPEAVIHFAGDIRVGESVGDPAKYFHNNAVNSICLFDAMLAAGVGTVVFSSSAAVYGTPQQTPIREDHPQHPESPYGESKVIVERVLGWYGRAYPLRWAALRYFNAAGADPEGDLGESHEPETHLIPLVIRAALGLAAKVDVYGTDYPTPDGTAIRDYVHVIDLAEAHVQALEYLTSGGDSRALNLGTGSGHSVREVIQEVERTCGRRVPFHDTARRAGDPPVLVASVEAVRRTLGWRPQFSDLATIVRTAWAWHSSQVTRS